jgi:hypothetical protein
VVEDVGALFDFEIDDAATGIDAIDIIYRGALDESDEEEGAVCELSSPSDSGSDGQ